MKIHNCINASVYKKYDYQMPYSDVLAAYVSLIFFCVFSIRTDIYKYNI